jgi:NitT/TauT family transport system substrate-binding protein
MEMPMMKKIIYSIIVASIIIGVALLLSRKQPSRVRIGYLPLAMHAPLFVAQEKGYFTARNIKAELIEYPSSDLLIKALLADRVDVGYELGTDVVFNAMAKDPTLLKIYQISLSYKNATSDYILIPIDSDLKSLADLRGKRLGVFPGPTASAFAKLTLAKAAQIDARKDLLLTSLPPQIQIDALASKKIDALFTYEPWASKAIVEKKAKILQAAPVEEYIINPWPGGVGVITKYFLARNTKARQVVEALYQAFDAIEKDPQIRQKVLVERFNLSPEVAKRIHLTKHWVTYRTQVAGSSEVVDRVHIVRFLQILVSEGIVAGPVETSGIYFEPNK